MIVSFVGTTINIVTYKIMLTKLNLVMNIQMHIASTNWPDRS